MRRAVYAGTFDPITAGHVSVIERARTLFEQVIVVIAVNPDKSPLFSVAERLALIQTATAHLSGIEATATEGMVVHLARTLEAPVLIRGVRSVTDAAYELELSRQNLALAPEVQTIFLPAEPTMADISSSRLKELARQGRLPSDLCPAGVLEALQHRLGSIPWLEGTQVEGTQVEGTQVEGTQVSASWL